ncbi:response regulator transcription factor [Flavobacterium sp. 123]|jgi:DNA-binding NarL/FixJ family response regulator|uniref:response regulator n=1 Tax=Flavobacterium sp. 123 TaxID=2135627 RepID=UPI000EAC5AEA|nr:response regulator transcription factor [Flavobacterium sp. 123]RKT00465.1 response regulator receiver domain-containing protein [Flavobacterium sp. 123]
MKSFNNNYSFLIADHHAVVRLGIAEMMKESLRSITIYESDTIVDTFKILKETRIDFMILGVNFPETDGVISVVNIKKIQPGIKILIFSDYNKDIYEKRYLNAGASLYINKISGEKEIKLMLKNIIVAGQN